MNFLKYILSKYFKFVENFETMKKNLFFLYFLFFFSFVFSQTELVFVYFKDKPNASAFLANPLSELSQKAIDRRSNLGISITAQDAPINRTNLYSKHTKFRFYGQR